MVHARDGSSSLGRRPQAVLLQDENGWTLKSATHISFPLFVFFRRLPLLFALSLQIPHYRTHANERRTTATKAHARERRPFKHTKETPTDRSQQPHAHGCLSCTQPDQITARSVRDGDHWLWQGTRKGDELPPMLTVFGISRPVAYWWQLVNNDRLEEEDDNDGGWKNYCGVKQCFEHCFFLHYNLTSVTSVQEFGPGDYYFALLRLERGSRVTDISPGNDALKRPCREWLLAKDLRGAGTIRFLGETCRVSRVSWELQNCDEVPFPKIVRHRRVGTKSCVEPEHLELGTHEENMAAKRRDGTQPEGESHPRATLTNDQALAPRAEQREWTNGSAASSSVWDLGASGVRDQQRGNMARRAGRGRTRGIGSQQAPSGPERDT